MKNFISVKNLNSGYGKIALLQNANFTLCKNQFTAIVGPNGSGKSTLLKTLLGLIPSLSGDVYIDGKNSKLLSNREKAQVISYVPQVSNAIKGFTVLDMVKNGRFAFLGPFGTWTKEDSKLVDKSLERLSIQAFRDRDFSLLSGGEARRVLVARALSQDGPCIFLDEPAAFLDPGAGIEIMELLKELALDSKCIVAVMHDLNHALSFCDQALLLDNSKIVQGSASAVLQPSVLARVFGTEFYSGTHAEYGSYLLAGSQKLRR